MRGTELYSSPRKITLTTDQLADVDAIKTAIATSASAAEYTDTDLDGALASAGVVGLDPPRFVSITTSSSASSYSIASPIVVTGTRGGVVVTESLSLTDEDGGETIVGDQPFDAITSISVPAQDDTSGQFEFGVSGIAARVNEAREQVPYRGIRVGATGGAVKLGFEGGYEDTSTYPADDFDSVQFIRLYGAGTTATPVTLYW